MCAIQLYYKHAQIERHKHALPAQSNNFGELNEDTKHVNINIMLD